MTCVNNVRDPGVAMTEPSLSQQLSDPPPDPDPGVPPVLASVPTGPRAVPLSLTDVPRGLANAGTGRVHQLLLAFETLATAPPRLPVLAWTVCWLARALTGADGAVLEDAAGAELVPCTMAPTSDAPLYEAGFVLSGLAARTRELQHCDDAADDPRCDLEVCRGLDVASMLAVPLLHEGELVAVLKVVVRDPHRFDERDDATLLTLAPSVAARLYYTQTTQQIGDAIGTAAGGDAIGTAAGGDAMGTAAGGDAIGTAQPDRLLQGVEGIGGGREFRDPLTGLENRWAFLADLERTISSMDESEECAVLFLGLDRLDEVNGTFGPEVGLQLLCRTAAVLRRLVRDKDEIARLESNQFVVLVRGVYDLDSVGGLADRIQRAVAGLHGCGISVTASVGVAMARAHDDPVEVLRTADEALAEAECTGGGVSILDEG
jgi:diguanylate cyclase (GGDEF)-like protein